MLYTFWSEEKVDAWTHINQQMAESVANTIAMTSSVHDFWDRALFALKPVSVNDEKTQMTLKFYWLTPTGRLPVNSSLSLPAILPDNYIIPPIDMPGNLKSGGWEHPDFQGPNLRLYSADTDSLIVSGDEIRITTDNPVDLPLPDWEFVSLQWTLHRLAALCAAAGYQPDIEYGDEDPDVDAAVVVTPPEESDDEMYARDAFFPSLDADYLRQAALESRPAF